MKKILFLMLLFVTTASYAQQNYVYCELVGTGKMMSSKINVQADFGQKTGFWKGVDYVKGEDGKAIKFNSMVDAMNYFGQQGWEFVQAYVVTSSNQNVYRWLLKKPISKDELDKVVSAKEEGEL